MLVTAVALCVATTTCSAVASAFWDLPIASFNMPSVATVGQTIQVRNDSFDPMSGDFIIASVWSGLRSSYSAPGTYQVSLRVENDMGIWSFPAYRTIVILSRPQPTWTPSPPRKQLSLHLSAASVKRGGCVTLYVTGVQNGPPRIVLPSSFDQSVFFNGQTWNYATINNRPWSQTPTSWAHALCVPWTANSPPNGTYVVTVWETSQGRGSSASSFLRVFGTATWSESLTRYSHRS